jgi:catechol 2,3-dioxygenase-like lactoylglutathione lyase family enzyme
LNVVLPNISARSPQEPRGREGQPLHLQRHTPMLSVADLRRTIAFYCNELGFQCAQTFGDPDPVWCCLRRDSVDLMFNQPPAAEMADLPPRAKDFQIYYFYPDDVAALHASWKAKGLSVTELRVTSYGMKEFELRDPDGYWLWFGQSTSEPATVTE